MVAVLLGILVVFKKWGTVGHRPISTSSIPHILVALVDIMRLSTSHFDELVIELVPTLLLLPLITL